MMDQMVSLGFNAIRLPFSLQLFDPGSTPAGIDYTLNPDLQGLTGSQIMEQDHRLRRPDRPESHPR